MELWDWNPKNKYPEIMSMDQQRMQGLAAKAFRMCCIASVMIITSSLPEIEQKANRSAFLKQVAMLFANISSDK